MLKWFLLVTRMENLVVKRLVFTGCVFLWLVLGCSSNVMFGGPPLPPVQPSEEIISFPAEGQRSSTNLGETLLYKHRRTTIPALSIEKPETWREVSFVWTIPAQKMKAVGLGMDGEPARWTGKIVNQSGIEYGLLVDRDLQTGALIASNPITVYKHRVEAPTKFTVVEEASALDFKQELIYNGRVGNDLRFVYREFYENMARSAFTQEAQYDLNESKIIGFKGARIEVIRATNSSITYRTLSNF